MLVSSLKYKIQIMLVSSPKYKIHMHARPSGAFYGHTCIFSLDAGDAGGADTKYKCTRHNCRLLRLFVQTVLAKKLHKRARTSRQKKDVRWKHELRIPHRGSLSWCAMFKKLAEIQEKGKRGRPLSVCFLFRTSGNLTVKQAWLQAGWIHIEVATREYFLLHLEVKNHKKGQSGHWVKSGEIPNYLLTINWEWVNHTQWTGIH